MTELIWLKSLCASLFGLGQKNKWGGGLVDSFKINTGEFGIGKKKKKKNTECFSFVSYFWGNYFPFFLILCIKSYYSFLFFPIFLIPEEYLPGNICLNLCTTIQGRLKLNESNFFFILHTIDIRLQFDTQRRRLSNCWSP